ncbi:MAG: twin-arginine translocase TatA/TatE family subunit [Armatimonadota bacterium]
MLPVKPLELLLIVGIILLLFGAKKLPELAKGMGQGLKEFKSAVKEEREEAKSLDEAESKA